MKADMQLARRLRGDDNNDYRDMSDKHGDDTLLSLPYRNPDEGMKMLRQKVAAMEKH